ncbi:MAG: recombinase family protein [Geodermatophilales bacterium]|nr:recombinase family protein [Geodermatophilales bacterium]
MSATTRLPWERARGKVEPWHRDRLAAVYVRQSTAAQVVEHGESTRLQYGLVERAVALGWARSRVLVIDEDLGHSAAGIDTRPGFARLVSEVGLNHVGLVLGIEMSRLARSGREWHQLLELCALSGALLGDLDGIYDPGEHNDRLRLGLKGTISEAELHLIRQRMWSGRMAKAGRGELAVPLPIGFVRRASGEVALDPDEQVQAVVRLVFDAFERLGTIGAVLAFLADAGIELGVRPREGPERGELVWRRPSRNTVANLLRNPAYAGIYAYGRSTVDPKRRRAGRPCTGRVRLERGNWRVFLPGVGPSYISVEQFERNLERMDANRARADSLGAVRDGPALLAGLVVCGRCGRRMTVHYQRGPAGRLQPVYACDRAKVDYAAASCQQLAGACLDAHVAELLLAAIAPAALEVSLAAAEQVEAGRAEVDRIWRARLERAEFAADRARRQYQLAEPENRLVVRQLERDWEAALAERERLGEEYARFTAARPRALSAAERDQIRALAADVPGIWHAPSTTDADRKQLIRALVEQVHVSVLGVSEQVDVEVVWAGGHRTRTRIVRPVAKLTQLSYYPQLAARARELVEAGHSTAQIAERLNAEGFRPPKRSAVFTPNAVVDLLRALGIRRANPARRSRPVLGEHEWWLRDLAGHLGMPAITLDAWVRRGWATGYLHPKARLIVVRADPAEVDRLRALHQLPQGAHTRRPWLRNQAALLNLDQEGAPGNAQPQL